MEDFPKTILDLEDRFPTEEACRDYLFKLRWPDGFRCPRCSHDRAWRLGRHLHMCGRCRFQVSVTAGTIFQDTRKPMRLWFRAIWYVTTQKHGISALGLKRVLGLGSYETAWNWMHKLRHAMVRPQRDRLSGTVELDEIFLVQSKEEKRRGREQRVLVLVAAQEEGDHIGRIRLLRLDDDASESLVAGAKAMIETGSTIRTDDWRGYAPLASQGYQHEVIRHESALGYNLLPRVNRVAALLRRWLVGTHHGAVQRSHLDYYLDEFTFRFNRRRSRFRGQLFLRLLEQAVEIDPITGKNLKGGSARP